MIAQALINFGLDDSQTAQNQNRKVALYLAAAVLFGVFGVLATGLTGTALTIIVAVGMVALVADGVVQIKRTEAAAPSSH